MIKLIEDRSKRSEVCEKVLRSLPQWFGIEEATRNYIETVPSYQMFAFCENGHEVGFLSVKSHSDQAAEIYVMGVQPEFHRRAIGAQLVEAASLALFAQGFQLFTVKTLSPRRESEAYAKTRKFYQSQGFFPVEEFPNLWGEDNPCLFLAKVLKATNH